MSHLERVKKTEHFTKKELECSCGTCEYPGMDRSFMELLEEIREDYGKPIYLSSAYRCPEYNVEVSSTGPNGPHTTGKAVDILVSGEEALGLLYSILLTSQTSRGLGIGVGVKQVGPHNERFIHLDTLRDDETKGPRPWLWSYT